MYAEASVTGRKKDAVRECANEACKMLDAYGLLRQSSHGEVFPPEVSLSSSSSCSEFYRLTLLYTFTGDRHAMNELIRFHSILESRKRRERNLEEDDFYESDEDNFLDRTGTSMMLDVRFYSVFSDLCFVDSC